MNKSYTIQQRSYPGKIGLFWGLVLIFLIILFIPHIQEEEDWFITIAALWAISTSIAWILTWKWLNVQSREDRRKAGHKNSL